MEMDWEFTGEDDFGLASSFSSAPVFAFAPTLEGKHHTSFKDVQAEAESDRTDEIRSDGFCFKLAPTEDVSHSIR